MKNNRKKKRFKLIKVKRKPEVKKERPFVQEIIDFYMQSFGMNEKAARAAAFSTVVWNTKPCTPTQIPTL